MGGAGAAGNTVGKGGLQPSWHLSAAIVSMHASVDELLLRETKKRRPRIVYR